LSLDGSVTFLEKSSGGVQVNVKGGGALKGKTLIAHIIIPESVTSNTANNFNCPL
jgi:hypothetical protein